MLLLGLLFLLWYRLLPLTVPPTAGETPAGTDRR
jgi:hypothetical protein